MNQIDTYMPAAEAPPPFGGLFAVQSAEDYEPDIFDLPEGDEELPQEVLPAQPTGGTVQMRDYQARALHNIYEDYRQGVNSTLCVSATGTGKSIMLASLAKDAVGSGDPTLILVHRDELIRQLLDSCARVGLPALVEKASEKALPLFGHGGKTVIASVQTLRGPRLEQWPHGAFGQIIVDEAHHIVADSYLNVLKHFGWRQGTGKPRLAGFTATADRLDKRNVGRVFESLAFEYNLRAAVMDGWLVPLQSLTLETDPAIDLRDLRAVAGDFNARDLEEVITQSLNAIVNAIVESGELGSRRAIAFTPDIQSSQLLAAALEKVGITANWIAGNSTDRADKLRAHRAGQFQVLCNCMLAVEGYDDKAISAVLLCRPTKSRGLLSQMVGRGTRLCPEVGKKDCLIVDFAYLTQEHDLAKPVHLYDDGKLDPEIAAIAEELADQEHGGDIGELFGQAEAIHHERVKERIRRQKLPVRAGKFDPLGIASLFDIPLQKEGYDWQDVRKATPAQIQALQWAGVEAGPDYPFAQAKKLLDVLVPRHKHGWSTLRQINDLISVGIDPDAARGMRRAEAKAYLDQHPAPVTDGQRKFLKWRGMRPEQIDGLTKLQASEMINKMKGAGQ